MKLVPLLRTLRKGDTRARLSALRAGGRALDVAIMSSALRTGVVAELSAGPRSTADLAAGPGLERPRGGRGLPGLARRGGRPPAQ